MTNFTSSCGAQAVEVAPVVLRRFAAAGTLDVDDLDDRRRHARRSPMAAGLEHHRAPAGEQPLHQRIDVLLQQRLAAGDLDQRAAVRRRRAPTTSSTRHLAALVEGVRRVAPRAAEVAGGQADEHARPPGVRRLALNRVEDLVDRSAWRSPQCTAVSIYLTIAPWPSRPSTPSPPERPARTPEVFWIRRRRRRTRSTSTRNRRSREFLEKHIDADRFLDFVSTRSPVFKDGRCRSRRRKRST